MIPNNQLGQSRLRNISELK